MNSETSNPKWDQVAEFGFALRIVHLIEVLSSIGGRMLLSPDFFRSLLVR